MDPIKALFWAALVIGVLATPLMVAMMLIATNGRIMGRLTLTTGLRIGGWAATGVMALSTIALFVV